MMKYSKPKILAMSNGNIGKVQAGCPERTGGCVSSCEIRN